MKIAFLSASLSRQAGGIFEIEVGLAENLANAAVEIEAYGLEDQGWLTDRNRWARFATKIFPTRGPSSFGYAPGMAHALISSSAEALHLHTMWMYPSVVVQNWSSATRKPYLVTPNGMLEPWALKNSAWKKKLAGILYEKRMLQGAACLQANTVKELHDFRAYGLKSPVAVIPNGIDLPELTDNRSRPAGTSDHGSKVLLFLGRLHPKKGLVNAIRAWSEVRGQDEWQFVIAGWDQGGHEAELKRLCDELGLSYAEQSASDFVNLTPDHRPLAAVNFLGPAFGETKDALLRRADAFILPSFSEGLPMSVLEAWSYRLPVLMTDHCNLPEGFAHDAALRIGTDADSIAQGMRLLLRSPTSDLRSLGQNGRALVEQQFTWPQVAAQMKQVYEWVLGGGGRPDCVV